MRWTVFLLILLWSTLLWQEGNSRVLNKNDENIVKKLEGKEIIHDLHHIRGKFYKVGGPNYSITYNSDEQDALLFQHVLLHCIRGLQRSIRLLSTLIRIGGDTFAGVLSGVVKAVGGLLGLTANMFWFVSSRLALSSAQSPFIGKLSNNCAYGLRSSANMMYGLSEACIWSGEILESVTLGLGEAVQDSFWGLEMVSNRSDVIVRLLLKLESDEPATSLGLGGSGDTSKVTASAEDSRHASKALRHKDPVHPLRPRQLGESYKASRAVEEKLGGQWMAPETTIDGNLNEPRPSSATKERPSHSSTADPIAGLHSKKIDESNEQKERTQKQSWRLDQCLVVGMEVVVGFVHYALFELSPQIHRTATELMSATNVQASAVGEAIASSLLSFISALRNASIASSAKELGVALGGVLGALYGGDSQGVFFLLAMLATFLLSSLPFPNFRWKLFTVLSFSLLVYVSFVATESVQRGRIEQRTAVESSHSLLQELAQQRSVRQQRVVEQLFGGEDPLNPAVQGTDYVYLAPSTESFRGPRNACGDGAVLTNIAREKRPAKHPHPGPGLLHTDLLLFDDATWANAALVALWEVMAPDLVATGGMGPYISDMYADMVNAELAKVPPGVANVRLKKFELGRSAPLFKGVRVYRERNTSCLQAAVEREERQHRYDAAEALNDSSELGSTGFNTSAHEGLLIQMLMFIEQKRLLPDRTVRTLQSHIGGAKQARSKEPPSKQSSDSNPSGWRNAETKRSDTRPGLQSIDHPVFLEQFSAQCDRLVVEMDAVYASKDMGVVLTLRNSDLKTLLPEVAVTLAEVHLAGKLRLNMSLSPDYPFIGEGQLSFMSAPQLAFSITSFGGLELSTVPYAFHWVNSSMHWLLEQYTAPHYVLLDLRHTICPSCDQAVVPLGENVRSAVKEALGHAKVAVARASQRIGVTALVLARLINRLRQEWSPAVAAGREHAGRLAVLLQQAVRGGVSLGNNMGAKVHTLLEQLKADMRVNTRLNPLRRRLLHRDSASTAETGVQDSDSDDADLEEEEGLHFAWYKGLEDVEEGHFAGPTEQQQQQQWATSSGLGMRIKRLMDRMRHAVVK